MIAFYLTADEAKFLVDCIAARRCATREAHEDAATAEERLAFFDLLAMGTDLGKRLIIARYADERHKLERSAQ